MPGALGTIGRWVQRRPLDVKLGLIGGLSVAVTLIASAAARNPNDFGAWVAALIAALVPVGFIVLLASRTNRRTAEPGDVPWAPPPSAADRDAD